MTPLQNCVAAPQRAGRLIDVGDLSRFVLGLKSGAPERIIVSAITGVSPNPLTASYGFSERVISPGAPKLLDVESVCSGPDGAAAPSLRIAEFVKAFGSNGHLESICDQDFGAAFGRVAQKIAQRIQ